MKHKRIFLVPFGAIAGVLVVVSVAFACTRFLGNFTVWGGAAVTPATDSVSSMGTDPPTGTATCTTATQTDCIINGTFVSGSQMLSKTGTGIVTSCGGLSLCGPLAPGKITVQTTAASSVPAVTQSTCLPTAGCAYTHSGFTSTKLPALTYTVYFFNGPVYHSHQFGVGGQGRSVGQANTCTSSLAASCAQSYVTSASQAWIAGSTEDYQWGVLGNPSCFQLLLNVVEGRTALGTVTVDTAGEISGATTGVSTPTYNNVVTGVTTATYNNNVAPIPDSATFGLPLSTPDVGVVPGTNNAVAGESAVCVVGSDASNSYANQVPVTVL